MAQNHIKSSWLGKMLLYSVYLVLLTSSCDSNSKIPTTEIEKSTDEIEFFETAPIDTILGDKILDKEKVIIRPNNFHHLSNMSVKDIPKVSELYRKESIAENIFLLKQKKKYSEARLFNLLIKSNGDKIQKFLTINDFEVSSFDVNNDFILLGLSDFDNANTYWSSEQQIWIMLLNHNLEEVWSYRKNSEELLFVDDVTLLKNGVSFKVGIIDGCHMCYNVAELLIDHQGKFHSAKHFESVNATEKISDERIMSIFEE